MEKVKFKDIFSFEKKSKIKAGDGFKLGEGKYPFYTSSDTLSKTLNEFLFEKESLIFGTGGLASVHHCNDKFAVSTDCFVTQPKDLKSVYAKYVYFYLSGNMHLLENGFKGAGLKHISKVYIEDLEIPLPSLKTQQKIAAILDKADELRQYNKRLIEKYDALTQSLFLDMFGDPVKNEKRFFKSTVGEQCSVKGGKRVPKDEKLVKENTGYPYIKAGNIKKGKVTTKDLEYLLPSTREKLKRYIVNEGDVCITVVGANIGDIGIVPKELHHANLTENANKLLIRNMKLLNGFYLASYLQMDFIQKDISKKIMAVGVPKLALFRIEQLELLLPPIELQMKFQERVQLIETQKQQAQEALAKSEALFQGLLQQAFKGQL
jgi:type I restriction enzyme S subunit